MKAIYELDMPFSCAKCLFLEYSRISGYAYNCFIGELIPNGFNIESGKAKFCRLEAKIEESEKKITVNKV